MADDQPSDLKAAVHASLIKAETSLLRLQDLRNPPSAGAVVQTVLTLVSELRQALDQGERQSG